MKASLVGLLILSGCGGAVFLDSDASQGTADGGTAPVDASFTPHDAQTDAASGDAYATGDADSGQPDAGPYRPCIPAPSPGRGDVSVVYAPAIAPLPASVAARCSSIFVATAAGSGPRPWETGTLIACSASDCAGTAQRLATGDLHFPVRFSIDSQSGSQALAYGAAQPWDLSAGGNGNLDGTGDVLQLSAVEPVTNLGPILAPLEGMKTSIGQVVIRKSGAIYADTRYYSNTDNTHGVSVIHTLAGITTTKRVASPGQGFGFCLDGSDHDRLFAIGNGNYPNGTRLIDEANDTSSEYVAKVGASPYANYYGFINVGRYLSVAYGPYPSETPLQLSCESSTTCAAPTVIANTLLPKDFSSYLGFFAKELIWKVPNGANPALIDLVSCNVATWDTVRCVPATLASGVAAPESPVAYNNWNTIFYVAGGKVIRVGL